MGSPHPPADAGQATVEFVALLPLVVTVLALAWQAVLAGHAAWAASTSARAAARAAALGADPALAARAHLPARLEAGLRVARPRPGLVEVSVRIPQLLPQVGLGRVAGTARFRPQVDAP
jgi:hypothetical protein